MRRHPPLTEEEQPMAARQRGFARKRSTGWLAVWRENGRERSRGGYVTKTEALDYANAKAAAAVALADAVRFRDPMPEQASPGPVTVGQLVDSFLEQHDVDEATTDKL